MKDIVKQFKESISKLTPEEFKKSGMKLRLKLLIILYLIKTKCFEYKINNTKVG